MRGCSCPMENFGVNLVCVEDGIDSSKDAGKLMISVLSAVQECMGTKASSTRRMAPSIKTIIITDANIAP